MTSLRSALDADWLEICRRSVGGLERMLADSPSTAERAVETGTRGSGGDRTLVIDHSAEDLVFDELDRLREEGYRFLALSEERGEIDYGDDRVLPAGARAWHDRRLAVPGRGRSLRRNGVAAPLARRGRRGRPADRAGGRGRGELPSLR